MSSSAPENKDKAHKGLVPGESWSTVRLLLVLISLNQMSVLVLVAFCCMGKGQTLVNLIATSFHVILWYDINKSDFF